MVKAVIFDWNGVVVDDIEVNAHVDCDIIVALGGKRISIETCLKQLTQDWWKLFIKYGVAEKDIPKVIPMVAMYYPKYAHLASIDDDLKEVLEKMKQKEIILGVLSGTSKKTICNNIEKFKLDNLFSFIISDEDVAKSKPHPEGLKKCIKLSDTSPRDIIYVDDMPTILKEAKGLGMTTIGYKSILNADLSEADYVVSNMTQLWQTINNL